VPEDDNELDHASEVVAFTGAHHHKFVVDHDNFFDLLTRLIWHNDEPLTFPASIPLYILSRETKEKATVVLSGEGADELFAGYSQNLKAYRIAQAKRLLPSTAARFFADVLAPGNRIGNLFRRLAETNERNVIASFNLYPDMLKQEICGLITDGDEEDFTIRLARESLSATQNFLSGLLYFQLKTYLCALLLKQDKMSMAASIETRVPYLDYRIAEFAFALPNQLKVRGTRGKHLLRRVARTRIPDSIIDRKKAGFPVPIHRWFEEKNNPFVDALLSDETRRNSFLNYTFIERAVDGLKRKEANASLKVWMLLNLELWRRTFFAN
jgi:asparagine synthase (glutamine-hydrolysing)